MTRRDRNHCVTPPSVGVSCHACALRHRDKLRFGPNYLSPYSGTSSVTGVTKRDISHLSQQSVTRRFCHASASPSRPSMEASPGRPLLPQHPDAERRLNIGDPRRKRLNLKSGHRVPTPSRPGHSTGAQTASGGAVLKGVTLALPVFTLDWNAINPLNGPEEDSKSLR